MEIPPKLKPIKKIIKARCDNMDKVKREAIWRHYIGDSLDGKCYVCLGPISFNNCHMAHIVPKKDGGKFTIDNIVPTCQKCNLSMGTKNLLEFKREHEEFMMEHTEVKLQPMNNDDYKDSDHDTCDSETSNVHIGDQSSIYNIVTMPLTTRDNGQAYTTLQYPMCVNRSQITSLPLGTRPITVQFNDCYDIHAAHNKKSKTFDFDIAPDLIDAFNELTDKELESAYKLKNKATKMEPIPEENKENVTTANVNVNQPNYAQTDNIQANDTQTDNIHTNNAQANYVVSDDDKNDIDIQREERDKRRAINAIMINVDNSDNHSVSTVEDDSIIKSPINARPVQMVRNAKVMEMMFDLIKSYTYVIWKDDKFLPLINFVNYIEVLHKLSDAQLTEWIDVCNVYGYVILVRSSKDEHRIEHDENKYSELYVELLEHYK